MKEAVRRLVPEQRRPFDRMIAYAKELRKFMEAGGEKPEAPRLIVHGGAGSGKSELIRVLSFWFEMVLTTAIERDLNMPFLIRCAPTGLAAHNIDGLTVCSAFKFRFGTKHMPLDTKVRDSYQQNLAYLQLVIIDEMSMVKADDLYKIDMRLREIKSNHDDFFGGVAVMFLGDLMQLQPIKGRWIYEEPKDPSWKNTFKMGGTGAPWGNEGGLWNLFHPYIFKENHRQGDNKEYADILNRLRFGQHNEEDVAKIRSRVVGDFPNDVPDNSILIFCKNKQK